MSEPAESTAHPDEVGFVSKKQFKRHVLEMNRHFAASRLAEQAAAKDRERHTAALEGMNERLDDLANAIRDTQRTPVLDSDRYLEVRKDKAKALNAALRSEWGKLNRRAHWLLSGAPPIHHSQTILQAIFGERTNVSPSVHTMLTDLTQFSVRAFMPRDAMTTEEIPLETRMSNMAQAVVTLAAESVPKEPKGERAHCLRRVKLLRNGFMAGVNLLTRHSMEHRETVTDPDMAKRIAAFIDADMATWTDLVHLEVVYVGKTNPVTPPHAIDLSPVPIPDWCILTAFLSSGELTLACKQAMTKRENPAIKSEDCRRFLQGRCNRKNCWYRHRTSDAVAGSEPKSGGKRGQAAAATTPSAKIRRSAKALATTKATAKAKAAAPDYSDSDESD